MTHRVKLGANQERGVEMNTVDNATSATEGSEPNESPTSGATNLRERLTALEHDGQRFRFPPGPILGGMGPPHRSQVRVMGDHFLWLWSGPKLVGERDGEGAGAPGRAEIKKIVDEVGADSMKDMGKVMGAAQKKLAGKADGKTMSGIVRELLS